MKEVLFILFAYLIGSIPTAVWISRYFFGVDIRDYGSGNAGATNTFRVLGSKWGCIVMSVDVLKGFIATSLYILLPFYMHNEWDRTNLMVGLGLAAVVGHIFPLWADFRGGKGVATALGIFAVLSIPLGIFTATVWLLAARFGKISSLSALCAFALSPFFAALILSWPLVTFSFAVTLLIFCTHRSNISRLISGQEKTMG